MTNTVIQVTVSAVEQVADNIRSYILKPADNQPLPAFSAGAHIDLLLDNGLIRQYSLCSDPENRDNYRIAVLKEITGRGGSEYIHSQLKQGSLLKINAPRNHFKLDETAENYLLVAGGIGITPLMLMARRLKLLNKNFTLHYLVKTRELAAFVDELQEELGEQCSATLPWVNQKTG